MTNTQPTVSFNESDLNGKPFFTHCASNFGNFLRECLQFWEETPLVREAVEKDLRADALAAKHERQRQEQDALLESAPLWDSEEVDGLAQACSLELETGQPRMPAKMGLSLLHDKRLVRIGLFGEGPGLDNRIEHIGMHFCRERNAASGQYHDP